MGFLQGLFGSAPSNTEKILADMYIPMFQMMGLSLSQAKESFAKMLNDSKEEGLREGTANLPENWGDIVLQRESADEKVRSSLAKLRREGVTDQDIRNWWNQPDLARRMVLKTRDITHTQMFLACLKKGMTDDEAGKAVWKAHVLYGDPEDTSLKTGDDRPLPLELYDRINVHIGKWMNRPAEEYRQTTDRLPALTHG